MANGVTAQGFNEFVTGAGLLGPEQNVLGTGGGGAFNFSSLILPASQAFGAVRALNTAGNQFIPSGEIVTTPATKALKKDLFASLENDLLPQAIQSTILGNAAKTLGRQKRATSTQARSIGARPEVATGGRDIASLLGNLTSQVGIKAQGISAVGAAQKGFALETVQARLQALRIEQFEALARARAEAAAQAAKQQAGAGRGGAFGTLAGLGIGALLAAPTGGLSLLEGAAIGGIAGGAGGQLLL